jgi:hypothetical protein
VPQINFYVPRETAEELRRRAKAMKLPVSKYVAGIVSKEVVSGWPRDFFETTFGKWRGRLERPAQPPLDKVDSIS